MNLVDRAKNIILTPKTEWLAIAGEEPNVGQIVTGYVIPLALIPAVGQIIGMGFLGAGAMSWGFATALIGFISAIAGVYISSFIVDLLAPSFGSQKNFGRALQLVAYSYTPAWITGILYIIPAVALLVLVASLYGLYLLFLGLPHTMKTPADKVAIYLIVSIIVVIIVTAILSMVFGAIIMGIFGLSALSTMH